MSRPGQQILDSPGKAAFYDWGMGDYGRILRLQEELRTSRENNEIDDIWIAGQHPAVITQGVRGGPADLVGNHDIQVFEIDRGGQTTIHNPGQVVIYPIIRTRHELTAQARIPRMLLTGVQSWIEGKTGIRPEIFKGRPGLFWNHRKVAAVGISIHRGITMHGIAINICNDLGPWINIVPCGEPDTFPVTLNEAARIKYHPVDFLEDIPFWLMNFWGYQTVKVMDTLPTSVSHLTMNPETGKT